MAQMVTPLYAQSSSPGSNVMRQDWWGGTGGGIGVLLGISTEGVISVKGVDKGGPAQGKVLVGDIVRAVGPLVIDGKVCACVMLALRTSLYRT